MMKIVTLFFTLFLIGSCEFYEDIELVNMGKVRFDKLDGNTAVVSMDVELDNPNFYTIKVKPSSLDVYVEDEFVGKANLLEKIKIKKKKVGVYNVKVELVGEEGILKQAIKFALKKDLKVRLVGKVKGSVFFVSKKIAVDETKTIDGRMLKLDMPFFE